MKKIGLLVLVAFFGLQTVSVQAQMKRMGIEKRIKNYKATHGITQEQEAQIREIFSELTTELSDDEFKQKQSALMKKVDKEVMTDEQKQEYKAKRASKAAAKAQAN